MVERVQKRPVVAHKGGFRGGGTGVDSKERTSLIACQVFDRHLMPGVAFLKCMEIRLAGEQGFHPVNLEFHLDTAL